MTSKRQPSTDVDGLPDQVAISIVDWRRANSGAGGFLPAIIQTLPLSSQQELATNAEYRAAWEARELERVSRSPRYFLESYGSVEPPRGSPAPFALWPAQVEALDVIRTDSKVWVLKARRLGLTWLALHYAYWLAAFAEDGTDGRILVFCKHKADASKLLDRVKSIHSRLPPFLRPATGKDSATTFSLPDRRVELVTLAGTEAAARQETASLVILDEYAFTRNGSARGVWTAVQPTIEGGGQLIGISTGNGRTGDGETFATVWDEAIAGRSGVTPIFLPWNARPDRTTEWREAQRQDYLSDFEFYAEYPETSDQALAGLAALSVYPLDGVSAAERIGKTLDPLTLLSPGVGLELGIDWGDTQTFGVYALALPGGGVYILDEKVLAQTEPSDAARQLLGHQVPGLEDVPITHTRADAAPAGTNRTFVSVLAATLPDVSHQRVPFSQYKEGGGERRGVNTVGYIRSLLESSITATAETAATSGGLIVIHPRCVRLLNQLRSLERDTTTGKVRKPALDPSDLSKGDHGPDAMVALMAVRATKWQARAHRDRNTAENNS